MDGLFAAIMQSFAADRTLTTFFVGGCTHGTVQPGTPRPLLSFKFAGDGETIENTSQRDRIEHPRILYTAECNSDLDAFKATKLIESRIRGMVGRYAGGTVFDVNFLGRTCEEGDKLQEDGTVVWEATVMYEYCITTDRML